MRAPRDSLTRVQSLAKESLVPLPGLGELMLEPLLEIVTTPTALMLQNTSFPRSELNWGLAADTILISQLWPKTNLG